jgi:hypothetical protein
MWDGERPCASRKGAAMAARAWRCKAVGHGARWTKPGRRTWAMVLGGSGELHKPRGQLGQGGGGFIVFCF